VGYDTDDTPFLFDGVVDRRAAATQRVAAFEVGGESLAYDFGYLAAARGVDAAPGGVPVVVVWTPGATSALDAQDLTESRAVGSTGVFERTTDGRVLTFAPNPRDAQTFLDRETGSTWNIFGKAVAGPLAGTALTPIVHATPFWFAWSAFEPDATFVTAPD